MQYREYLAFPEFEARLHSSAFKRFRSEWVLQRRHRPAVPCPMRTPLPHGGMTKQQRARLCNVYMRPWVLHYAWATLEVPHITHLDRIPVVLEEMPPRRAKLRRKTPDPSKVQHVGHRAAWKHYIRGNVISESSVTLIANLLSVCSAMANTQWRRR